MLPARRGRGGTAGSVASSPADDDHRLISVFKLDRFGAIRPRTLCLRVLDDLDLGSSIFPRSQVFVR
ncbi:MAG: hypothetical protein K0S56_1212 [Microvirga sp.]|jgi:hypothetical protein|nr:hypothetical protein [Microvirga sp.]